MVRPESARRLLGLALGVGVIADVLLDGPALGLNVVLSVVALLAAAVAVRPRAARYDPADVWLPPAAIVAAGFVAIRSDPVLVTVDTVVALVLTAASAAAIGGVSVTRLTTGAVLDLGSWMTLALLEGPIKALGRARQDVGLPRADGRLAQRSRPILRGLALASPLLLAFLVLFASADLILGRWLESAVTLDVDLGGLPGRVLFVAVSSWLAAGALWFAATVSPAAPQPASLGAAVASAETMGAARRSVGGTEGIVVLVSIDLLFGLFVVLQVAYLFGGGDTRAAAGLTFSDYARRGFFELLLASALAGAVVAGLEATVRDRTRAYVGAALALLGLTAFVLVSAVARMRLYQEAYGWTELRFYALAGIAFVGLGLVAAAVLLVRRRSDRLPHALGAAMLAVLLGVNVVGPQAFVAGRNIDRALHPERIPADGERSLDADYLGSLGDDSIPLIVDAFPALAPSARARLAVDLDARRRELAGDPALAPPQAWNLARVRAREALERLPSR